MRHTGDDDSSEINLLRMANTRHINVRYINGGMLVIKGLILMCS